MAMSRVIILLCVIIIAFYLFKQNLQQTIFNNIILLIGVLLAGAFLLLTKAERILFMTEIKAMARSLNNTLGRNS
jgi:high-affinity nickel permease